MANESFRAMVAIGELLLHQDNRVTADPIFQVHDGRSIFTPKIVTQCFSERACADYIAQNSHHMKNPTIYAESLWRNYEMIAIRNYLMEIAKERND